jgi:hypothetical protein
MFAATARQVFDFLRERSRPTDQTMQFLDTASATSIISTSVFEFTAGRYL